MADDTDTTVVKTSNPAVFPFYPLGPIIGSVPNVPEGYWNAVSWEQRLKWLCQNMAALVDWVNEQTAELRSLIDSDGVGALVKTDSGATPAFQLIDTPQLEEQAVTNEIIADNAVTTDKIEDGTIVPADLAAYATDELTFTAGSPTSSASWSPNVWPLLFHPVDKKFYLHTGAYITEQMIAGYCFDDPYKFCNQLIDNRILQDGCINDDKVANASLTPAKINASSASDGQVLTASGGTATWADAGSATLDDGSVTTEKLADDSVTISKIGASGANNGEVITVSDGVATWGKVSYDGIDATNLDTPGSTVRGLPLRLTTDGSLVWGLLDGAAVDDVKWSSMSDAGFGQRGVAGVGSLTAGTNTTITVTLPYAMEFTIGGHSNVFTSAYCSADTTIDVRISARPTEDSPSRFIMQVYNTGAQDCTDLEIAWLCLSDSEQM